MSCVVQWWDVLFVKGMHFSSKNARLLNLIVTIKVVYCQFNQMSFQYLSNFSRRPERGITVSSPM